jgi:monofunctional biosynthetic peptidoglycan transglycosylase
MDIRRKQFAHDKTFTQRHIWVDYPAISPYAVRAVIASEDNRFCEHKGFDWVEINHAIQENKDGKRRRGASTITQQTAKNVFLWPESSWLRKGLETYYTILIEMLWNKRRIMEVYLNIAEMGKGIYGVEAASQYYFKKSAAQLTAGEAALIAACLPNPLQRNPAKSSPYMNRRKTQILALMRKTGPVEKNLTP